MGKRKGFRYAVIMFILIVLATSGTALEVTRKGIEFDLGAREEFTLEFKDISCESNIERIGTDTLSINFCGKQVNLEEGRMKYIDVNNDYIYDLEAEYEKINSANIFLKLKLTYKEHTNLDEDPVIEQIEVFDKETEEIINKSTSTKDLIRRLSQRIGIEPAPEIVEVEVIEANETDNVEDMAEMKEEMDSIFKNIADIPYITHIATGLLILAILIALIHFSSDEKSKKKFSDLFLEEEKPKKKSKKK